MEITSSNGWHIEVALGVDQEIDLNGQNSPSMEPGEGSTGRAPWMITERTRRCQSTEPWTMVLLDTAHV
jgi:hypothetical protein